MTEDASTHSASDQDRRHEEHIETLGHFLKRHRTSQGKSLEEIAKITRIHASTLQAIEEDNPKALPAEVFTKGFIRIYAQHLGLDPDQAIIWYVQQQTEDGGNPRSTEVIAGIQELTNPEQPSSGGRGGKMFLLFLLLLGLLAGYWYWTGLTAQQEAETDSAPVTETKPEDQPLPQPEPSNPLPETPTATMPTEPPQELPPPAPGEEAAQTAPPTTAPTVPVEPQPAATAPATTPSSSLPAEQSRTVTPPTADGTVSQSPPPPQPAAPAVTSQQQPPQPAPEAGQTTTPPPVKPEPFTLSARFTAKTLVRVRVDGQKEVEASYPPGEHPVWRADRKIVITIPNPENTTLFLNDAPVSLVGKAQKNLKLTFPAAE